MDIPRYPEHRTIELQDKDLFDGLFRLISPRISEFTFANLYLFRHAHSYVLTSVAGIPVVLGRGYGGESYFLPPLAEDPVPALAPLFAAGMTLYGVCDLFLPRFLSGGSYEIVEDRDNFDYLYSRHELAELAGSRYRKKKNRLNYLLKRHQAVSETFREEHLDEALAVLAEWQRVRAEEGDRSVFLEVAAAEEAVRLRKELGLEGIVALEDGKVSGFSLGERLNGDTAVCHFEKSDPFFEGLPQFLNREFCRTMFTGCVFVNREQDLGEPGLRTAKLSYHPVELVKKYRVRLPVSS